MNYIDVYKLYNELTTMLIEKGYTISTMESCTSGLVASLITDTEGASKVLPGAFVTYSNDAKQLQGVAAEVINDWGVYSTATAFEMASACRNTYDTDIGIGITGTFGNLDVNNKDSITNTVYASIVVGYSFAAFKIVVPAELTRFGAKLFVAQEVCKKLLEFIK